jgi:hypothetical protein
MSKARAFFLFLAFLLLWGAAFRDGGALSAQEAESAGAEFGEIPPSEQPSEYPEDPLPEIPPESPPETLPEIPPEDTYPAGPENNAPEEEYPDDYPDDDEVPAEDYTGFIPDLYSKGDSFFSINLGLLFPTIFPEINNRHNLTIPNYTGFLSYNYFLNAHWYIGGEIGGMFANTKGKNMLFIVPIGIRGGYQFVVGRFEFPVGIALGFAPQRYLDFGYPGFYLKAGGAAYFRFNPDWSFGINSYWWWVPQWFRDPSYNVNGNFMELTLSARYHF